MALTVQCQVPGCGAVVDSPPPDSCPKGHPFDPEMVAHQRAIAEGCEREYLRERRARARGVEQPEEGAEASPSQESPPADAPKRARGRKQAEAASEGEPQGGESAGETAEA